MITEEEGPTGANPLCVASRNAFLVALAVIGPL
jgi:hypothetical protein